jgi:hypothetical protein
MKKILLFVFLHFASLFCFSQNLVPNGSFENIKVSPTQLSSKLRPSLILETWQEVARRNRTYSPTISIF